MATPREMGVVPSATSPMTLTLPLKLRNAAAAEALLESMSSVTSPEYHRFLTPQQFRAQFAPSDEEVAAVVARLGADGLTAVRSGASRRVTGSAANIHNSM
jgi:subtilase family serine protease